MKPRFHLSLLLAGSTVPREICRILFLPTLNNLQFYITEAIACDYYKQESEARDRKLRTLFEQDHRPLLFPYRVKHRHKGGEEIAPSVYMPASSTETYCGGSAGRFS